MALAEVWAKVSETSVPAAKTRPYRQAKRAASAAETRRKVIAAARELLLNDDFQDVSIEAIAERARVGRSTVYQQFESKRGLLQAIELSVSESAGVEELIEVLQQPDALGSLRAAFELGGSVWARERDMFRKLFGLAHIDADLRAVMEEKDGKRQMLVRILVDKLATQKKLRRGVSRERAFQVLWLLTSFQTFDATCHVAASPEAAARLLLEMCQQALLEGAKKK
jgi:AcrR family transcriptional regulator